MSIDFDPVNYIHVRGAREHNLKNINVDIPKGQLVVITGVSGSGKSSLAFDTIYAEGQRRYVESLSAYARQFLNLMQKPDVDSIDGLAPAISIEQKTTSKNPRSIVGTVTEIYDYLRLLYARVGVPYSPVTGQPIASQTISQMTDKLLHMDEGTKLLLLAPVVRDQKGEHKKLLQDIQRKGFVRVLVDGEQYQIEEVPALEKNIKHTIEVVVDRLVVKSGEAQRLASSLETALNLSDGLCVAQDFKTGERTLFSTKYACPVSGFSIPEIEPRLFSFNSPHGACATCDGLGEKIVFSPELVVPDPTKPMIEAMQVWASETPGYYRSMLESVAKHYGVKIKTPFNQLPQKVQDVLLYGSGKEKIEIHFEGERITYTNKRPFEGMIPWLERRYHETESQRIRQDLERFQINMPCESCKGDRLNERALCVKIDGQNIAQFIQLSIKEADAWVKALEEKLTPKELEIGARILKEIRERLSFLVNVGLSYLTLNRKAGTLSGGESQRIRLASQIGSGLTGVLYVLDEPSIGLHQRDNQKLIDTLRHLKNLNNTVLVVEHDEDTMMACDHLIDMGPAAGVHGGTIVAEGTPDAVMQCEASETGQYLSGNLQIEVPKKLRKGNKKHLVVEGATLNNLKNVTAKIPLGKLVCITGVSGGGKSSLIIGTLYKELARQLYKSSARPGPHKAIKGLEHIGKVIDIDQSPIGRTPRSNPATYTGVFDPIRQWFAGLPEAKVRGYSPGRFSFNVKGGRCEACQGDGVLKIEMHFLPDVYVECDQCKGKRYNRETLEVTYKGKSISDVLEMTVEEGAAFFEAMPAIKNKLDTLLKVGLGYMQIGQRATTLSGGEAQRVKLAKELSKRATGDTLYILDEPTTGLHFSDIKKLLEVLHLLADQGNTVVVIEHNLDVIKTADWILDIGPEGGDGGGTLVAQGTPQQVSTVKASHTGQFLTRYFG